MPKLQASSLLAECSCIQQLLLINLYHGSTCGRCACRLVEFKTIVRHVRSTEAMADLLLAMACLILHAVPRAAISYCDLFQSTKSYNRAIKICIQGHSVETPFYPHRPGDVARLCLGSYCHSQQARLCLYHNLNVSGMISNRSQWIATPGSLRPTQHHGKRAPSNWVLPLHQLRQGGPHMTLEELVRALSADSLTR